MNNFKIFVLLFGISFIISCTQKEPEVSTESKDTTPQKQAANKVQVLNFGTFHMGLTSDANSTEFDQHNSKNQERVHAIAEKLADFNPTVIIVEQEPQDNPAVQKKYKRYLDNPDMSFEEPSEIELLAFELGMLSDTKRIYGIDHKMGYNYKIGHQIKNNVDPEWYNKYYNDPFKYYPEIDVNSDSLSLLEKLKRTNSETYLDFLKAVNADMLTHAGTEGNFEGADEAAKYYKRNLRMYTNLNRVDLDSDDRVFILMGASHTAFFRDFFKGDPKYKMVDTFEYLN